MEILIGIAIAFLFMRSGFAGTSLPGLSPTATNAVPVPLPTGSALTPAQATILGSSTAQLQQETSQGIGVATTAASAIAKAAGAASSFATVIPVIGSAVSAVANILLAQHTARLKGAIAENQLIPTCVQAFDADLEGVVDAYNANQATPAQCVTAMNQMQTSLYTFMKGNATGPGRAWKDLGPTGQGSGASTCNKACTAECCVFYDDFNPAIATLISVFNGTVQPSVYATKTATGWTVMIPEIYPPPSQYGTFSRASYTVTIISQK